MPWTSSSSSFNFFIKYLFSSTLHLLKLCQVFWNTSIPLDCFFMFFLQLIFFHFFLFLTNDANSLKVFKTLLRLSFWLIDFKKESFVMYFRDCDTIMAPCSLCLVLLVWKAILFSLDLFLIVFFKFLMNLLFCYLHLISFSL